jgi:hypothetical protein
LDEVHPFSDTFGVDGVLRDAERMLSPDMNEVGPKNAARIWGFLSKFVMLDRFAETLFGTKFHPASSIPRRHCGEGYLSISGVKVSILFPPIFCGFLIEDSVT